jgi:molybdenum-dependent DNA-binding transcriptional regulator ModE
MSDHLFALRLFARVARRGSFSAAGRELDIPQSTASRTIAELERKVGAPLLVRNTRAVTLTDAVSDFLARIEAVLAELEDAEQAVRGTTELRGRLRASASARASPYGRSSRISQNSSTSIRICRSTFFSTTSGRTWWPRALTSLSASGPCPTRRSRHLRDGIVGRRGAARR